MVRLVLAVAALVAGCAELGVGGDGSSISVGKPNNGRLIYGARLPDHGDGYTTSALWLARGNRYGTDELVDLVVGVARRMQTHVRDARLVVADLSGPRGGAERAFHRSHQSGRDVDFVFYERDADGKPLEPDVMRAFDASGHAFDGGGITIDIPRTWLLVKELLDAPEAAVQYIFIYEPLARLLVDHAKQRGEPDQLVARARKALRQPGDSARHDDHLHVRIYCSPADKQYGCVDIGPMDLLVDREARLARRAPPAIPRDDVERRPDVSAGASPTTAGARAERQTIGPLLFRARPDQIDFRRGR